MDQFDDLELEQTMRTGLERRAEGVDVAVAVVDRARRAARGRRTTRWAVVGVAAASTVAVVGVGLGLSPDDDAMLTLAPSDVPSTAVQPTGDPTNEPSTEPVRTEYWQGLQVQVPAWWTWGSTLGVCGAPPVGVAYVGRPIGYTDMCGIAEPDAVPTAPYVWLGADVPIGTVDLGDGWTRETIAVDWATLTVASRDADLRTQILGSAMSQDLCVAETDRVPRARFETTVEGVGGFIDGRLCAYRRNADGNGFRLVYAKVVDESTVANTFRAVTDAPAEPVAGACAIYEFVVVNGAYADDFGAPDARLDHDAVFVFPGCGVRSPDPRTGEERAPKNITEATVQPWATSEFKHLLIGPYDQWAYDYFIGVQG